MDNSNSLVDRDQSSSSFSIEYDDRNTFSAPLKRQMSTFGQLTRTLTGVGQQLAQQLDPDLAMTNYLIESYKKHDGERKQAGDFPLQTGFARKAYFWHTSAILVFVATIVALSALCFMNCVEHIPSLWQNCDFHDNPDCGHEGTGKAWWIPLVGGTGLVVGHLRYFASYPNNLPGLFKEVSDGHVNPTWVPMTFILSLISLSGGATLGPEQALGNLGGGLATYMGETLVPLKDQKDRMLLTLAGMCCALGGLFPSPILAVMLIFELGVLPKSYMECITVMSIGAIFSFTLYVFLEPYTWLNHISQKASLLSSSWIEDPGFKTTQILIAFVIGIVSSIINLFALLCIGICKQLFARIRDRFRRNNYLREVIPPVVGGLIIGTVNYALPATVGNGSLVIDWFIKYGGSTGSISRLLLFKTFIARIFLLGISMNCGFVGGIIYPFLTIGVIVGCFTHQVFPHLPFGLCVGTFMMSIACGVVPAPFTFTCLSAFLFFFGTYQTAPIFVSIVVSYTVVCGTGMFKKMVTAAAEKQQAKEDAFEAEDAKSQASSQGRDGSAQSEGTASATEENKRAEEHYRLKSLLGQANNIRDSTVVHEI